MKPLLLIPSIALLFLAQTQFAHAKGKKDPQTDGTYGLARFDANENGRFDPEEIAAIRKAFAEGDAAVKLLDANKDGVLDDNELAAAKAPSPAKKKKRG